MIPFELREALMDALAGETFEGVEAKYVGDATVDVAGATFRLTKYGTLTCRAGSKSVFGFHPDFSDMDVNRERFRMIVAWHLDLDYRKR